VMSVDAKRLSAMGSSRAPTVLYTAMVRTRALIVNFTVD
jgi:hypothetical protein